MAHARVAPSPTLTPTLTLSPANQAPAPYAYKDLGGAYGLCKHDPAWCAWVRLRLRLAVRGS